MVLRHWLRTRLETQAVVSGHADHPDSMQVVLLGAEFTRACAKHRGARLWKGVTVMGGKTDEVKGRIKEAAGALTGNDKLREEGKTDQAVGKAEQAVQKAADTVKEAVKKVID